MAPGRLQIGDQSKHELLVSKIEFNGNGRPANQHHKCAGVVPSGAHRPQFTPSPPPRTGADSKRARAAVTGGVTSGLPPAREPGDLAVSSVILGMIGAVLRMRPKSENQCFQCFVGTLAVLAGLLLSNAACGASGAPTIG
jgi:hypothetical protein